MKTLLPLLLTLCMGNAVAQMPRLVVPTGHTNVVSSAVFTPDGKYVLTGSWDNNAKLWDLAGHEIRTFEAHKLDLFAAAVSQDGNFVLTGSGDGTAKLWDRSGKMLRTFQGHRDWVYAVAFSPDGQYVLTGCGGRRDNSAKLWNRAGYDRDTAVFTLKHTDKVNAVAFSPDGQFLLTGCADKTAKLWDRATGKFIRAFPAGGPVSSVAFCSADGGKTLLVGSADGTAKLWNRAAASKPVRTFSPDGKVTAVAFSPDGKTIATGSHYGTITLWDAATGRKKEPVYEGHGNAGINAVAFSPVCPDDPNGGRYLVSASNDRTARIWTPAGETVQILNQHCSSIQSVAYAPDGQSVLTGSEDKTAKQWSLLADKVRIFPHDGFVTAVAYAPDGRSVLTGCSDGFAKLWNLNDDTVRVFKGHSILNAVSAAFTADGKYVVSGSTDGTAKLWNRYGAPNAAPVHSFRRSSEINAVACASVLGSQYPIIIGSADNAAQLWGTDGSEGPAIDALSQVRAVAYSPDGKYVLTGNYAGKVMLWDAAGEPVQTYDKHSDKINAVTFSPAGNQVLTGSDDNLAILWDRESGDTVRVFKHPNEVSSVAFSATDAGKTILTGCKDGAARFWDAATGKLRATLVAIDSADWVVITPSGLFDASPGAMRLMYYIQGTEVIELDQLKDLYYEPELLAQVMGFVGDGLRSAENLGALGRALCPRVANATLKGDQISVRLEKRAGGIGRVAVLVEGDMEIHPDANPQRLDSFVVDLKPLAGYFLPGQPDTVTLLCYDKDGKLPSQPYEIAYTATGTSAGRSRGNGDDGNQPAAQDANSDEALASTLYALLVGTSKYAGADLNLQFPDADASAVQQWLETIGKPVFADMRIKLLTTAANGVRPTKHAIQAALEEFAVQAKPNDVLLVLLSGHGSTWPEDSVAGRFYYLTADNTSFDFKNNANLKNALAQDSLQTWMRKIKARKRILILDACHSGAVVDQFQSGAKGQSKFGIDQRRALRRMRDRSGFFVLAGSAADKRSFEDPRYGHGLLTYSLLANMPRVAAEDKKNNWVDVGKLFLTVRDDVPKLAQDVNQMQEPKLIGMEGFPIGKIDETTQLPVLDTLFKIIRTTFFDPDRNGDVERLGAAVNNYLDKRAAERNPVLRYWDVDKSSGDYYTLSGKYKVSGDVISGDATLRFKDVEQANFPFSGSKTALDKLAKDIGLKVFEHWKAHPKPNGGR